MTAAVTAAAPATGWQEKAGHYLGDAAQALAQAPDAVRVLVSVVSGHPHGKAAMPGSVAAAILLALVLTWAWYRLKPGKRDT